MSRSRYLDGSDFSPGCDDEVFNVVCIAPGTTFAQLYTVSHNDVHPPGPYLIHKALWDATGNWSTARLTTAVFAATTIWLGADSIRMFLTTTSGLGFRASGGVWIACSLTG